MEVLKDFSDTSLCHALLARLQNQCQEPFSFMEVCGTHTVAIFRSGLRSLLPANLAHLSGPGCPVCVTHEQDVALYLELADRPDIILATFGDLVRVPGPDGHSLRHAAAQKVQGTQENHKAQIQVLYSPASALTLAQQQPDKTVVFLAIGFETTAPAVAATILMAQQKGIRNFLILPLHKLVPPALHTLLADPDCAVDALLLPGHVASITGTAVYKDIATTYDVPAVVAGFEPLDILYGLTEIVRRKKEKQAGVTNCYTRIVKKQGNPRALEIMNRVYEPCDALWRGIGNIANSGLTLRKEFHAWDARRVLELDIPAVHNAPQSRKCRCGDILKGKLLPTRCPLFGNTCTPANPTGPCMVSAEGACAAYFSYT